MFGSIPTCLNFRESFRYEAVKCFDEVTVVFEIPIIWFRNKNNYHISYVIEDMEQINQRTFHLTCDIILCDVLVFLSYYNSLFSSIAKRDSPLVGLNDAVYVCTSSGSLSVVSIWYTDKDWGEFSGIDIGSLTGKFVITGGEFRPKNESVYNCYHY